MPVGSQCIYVTCFPSRSHLLFAPQKGIFCVLCQMEVGLYLGVSARDSHGYRVIFFTQPFPFHTHSSLWRVANFTKPYLRAAQSVKERPGVGAPSWHMPALQPPNLYDRSLSWANPRPPHWLLHEKVKPGCVLGGGT